MVQVHIRMVALYNLFILAGESVANLKDLCFLGFTSPFLTSFYFKLRSSAGARELSVVKVYRDISVCNAQVVQVGWVTVLSTDRFPILFSSGTRLSFSVEDIIRHVSVCFLFLSVCASNNGERKARDVICSALKEGT